MAKEKVSSERNSAVMPPKVVQSKMEKVIK